VFVSGSAADLERDPRRSVHDDGRVLANVAIPTFPAWPDVVQLNAFAPAYRAAATETLIKIADQCDGVRCDMAIADDQRTSVRAHLGDRVGPPPSWTIGRR
jgi:hypothetical protein